MNHTDYKQVLVVRSDLNMQRGKEDSQVAHAAMSFLTKACTIGPPDEADMCLFTTKVPASTVPWLENAFTKITLAATSEQQLLDIKAACDAADLLNHLVTDNGYTNAGQGRGVQTITALGIGPAHRDLIDQITGPNGQFKLKLR